MSRPVLFVAFADGFKPFLFEKDVRQSVAACQVDVSIAIKVTRESRSSFRLASRTFSRKLASRLLNDLKAPHCYVGASADGCPAWPQGFVGSITHDAGLCGVAVASSLRYQCLGIDIESVMPSSVAEEVRGYVCSSRELNLLFKVGLDLPQAITLAFSAKEAFYKCIYPITRTFLDFGDVEIQGIDASSVEVVLTSKVTKHASTFGRLSGNWRLLDGRFFTSFDLRACAR